MPDTPPELNSALLAELARLQGEAESELDADTCAVADIMARLGQPVGQDLQFDQNALEEIYARLVATASSDMRGDRRRLLNIFKRLSRGVEAAVADDASSLASIGARANPARFPGRGQVGPTVPGGGGNAPMGGAQPRRPAGLGTPSGGAAALGLSGVASSASPGTARGSGGVSGAPFLGQQGPRAQTPPPRTLTPSPVGFGGSLQDALPLDEEPEPTENPYGPPIPASPYPGRVGGASPIPSLPPMPSAIPAAPAPPPEDCDLCQAVIYLAEALRGPLVAIADALRLLTPGAQAQSAQVIGDGALAEIAGRMEWDDPPNQPLTDRDTSGVYDQPGELAEEAKLLVTSGAGAGPLVSMPMTR